MSKIKTGDTVFHDGNEYICMTNGTVLYLYQTLDDLLYKRNRTKIVAKNKVSILNRSSGSVLIPDFWSRLLEESDENRYIEDV